MAIISLGHAGSFIDLEFMEIQSPDIMADSADAKQMLLTLSSKLDWLNPYILRNLALIFNEDGARKAV